MELTKLQLEQVDAQVKRLVKTDSYYGKMYRDMGIDSINSMEDFKKMPFSSKDDLRNAYPLGIQAVQFLMRKWSGYIPPPERLASRLSFLIQPRTLTIGQ